MVDSEFRVALERLLKRLQANEQSVIVVHESDVISKMKSRAYLAVLQDYVSEGTVSIMGDCLLNTQGISNESMSTQERLVLSSGPMLQLLTLQESCFYVSHPSLMIASVGKYARYLARSHELDFPFGENSVFSDFHGMDAVVLFIGENHDIIEAKYADGMNRHAVIRKNVASVGDELVDYLDYDTNLKRAHQSLFDSDVMIFEDMGDHRVYGITYKKYIKHLGAYAV